MMRIKGKRIRKDANSSPVGRQTRGRPLKSSQSLKPSPQFIKEQILQNRAALILHEQAQQPTTSTLESLPLEILNHIFFLSLELNLLRTSKSLEHALSTSSVHTSLILFAYFEDDVVYPVETKLFRPAEYRCLSPTEKLDLQRKVWKFDWCTPQFFETCLPKLWRLAYLQAWYHAVKLDISYHAKLDSRKDDDSIRKDDLETLENQKPPDLDDETNLEPSVLQQKFWQPRCRQMPTYSAETGVVDVGSTTRPSRLLFCGKRSVIGTQHLPAKLFSHRPWTSDQIVCLQLLRQGFANTEEGCTMDIDPEILFFGMANAIREHNIDALTTLLEIHDFYFHQHPARSSDLLEVTLPSRHPIPPELFHLATEQGEASEALLMLLVRAGIGQIPRDDEIITAWASHNSRSGNELAAWILDYMASDDPMYPGFCFRGGAYRETYQLRHFEHTASPSLLRRSRFPRTRFVEELGYLENDDRETGW